MSDRAPRQGTLQARVAAVGAGADATETVAVAPFDGVVARVAYVPDAAVTGANTDTRTLSVQNAGQAGSGTTSVATVALVAGVNVAAGDEKDLTLSGTPANLAVVAGDVLQFKSTHAGTGLADPGGLVQVDITA